MSPAELVMAIITSLPGKKIKGKKRLQKFAFLLKEAGLRYPARFDIRDYGPFSREIASAANLLAATGAIEEAEEPLGASRTFVTVYTLERPVVIKHHLSQKYKTLLTQLDHFPTVDLEVAATYQFFRSSGLSSTAAKQKTIELKPTKTSPAILKNIPKITSYVAKTA